MRTLVVPVDGSENSICAANYAADMALAIDADLHLLHIVRVVVTPEGPAGYVFEDMERAGKVLLEKMSNDLKERTRGQVNISSLLEIGSVEFKIEEFCLRIQPFAIVMGAPEGSFLRTLSGSPALYAARRLPYPVLVVPSGAVFRRIRTVVMACEAKSVSEDMPASEVFLQQLKELFDCRFDILHVGAEDEKKESKQISELYRWQKRLSGVDVQLHFLSGTNVVEAVNKYVEDNNADWLMVFPEKHGMLEFHKSQSKPLISRSTVPVLSICEAASTERQEEVKTHVDKTH
jgi:nucleotide-binding universal stress UspA family protein